MLKTSKATQPKSITTSRTKVKVITTSSTRKSRSETTSITNKKLFKLSTITPFTSLRTPTSSSTSSSTSLSPTTTSSSSFSPTTTSPPTTTSKSLLYPTLSLPRSSLPTSTSSSSLSSLSSLPFTTIFNSQSQQQPQQESQLQSFIITPHLHQQFNDPFCSLARSFQRKINTPFHLLTKSFQHKLLSQSNVFHSTKVQFKDESKPDYFEPLSIFDELGSLTPDVITFKYLNSNEFKAAMEEFELEARNNPIEALLTFTGAVAEHYPSKPLEFVTKFIRVNRTIFKRLFQHQIIKSIPSLKGDTTEQDEIDAKQAEIDEIVQIIFEWYHNIPKLISQLRGKGHSDENIGTLLSDLYPKHFHKEIDDVLLPKDSSQTSEQSSFPPILLPDLKIPGFTIQFYAQPSMQNGPAPDTILEESLKNLTAAIVSNINESPNIELKSHFFTKLQQLPTFQSTIRHIPTTHHDQNPLNARLQDINQITLDPNEFYFEDQINVQQIFHEFDIFYSPLLQVFDHTVTQSARGISTTPIIAFESSTFEAKLNQIFSQVPKMLSQQIKQTELIIKQLNDKHLVLSWQQTAIKFAFDFIQNKLFNKPTTTLEELNFQLITGYNYQTFLQKCQSGQTQLPCIIGPSGCGKSLILYIQFVQQIAELLRQYKNKKMDFNNFNRYRIILTLNTDQDHFDISTTSAQHLRAKQIECIISKESIQIFSRHTIDQQKAQKGDFIIHFCDPVDSPLSRSPVNSPVPPPSIKKQTTKQLTQKTAPLQQRQVLRKLPYLRIGLVSIEYQLASAQERFLYPNRSFSVPGRNWMRQPMVRPSAFPSPLLLQTPSSYRQTALSLLKSSLYEEYLKSHPTATQEELRLFLIELNKLTIIDLYNIDLFNEWDNGKSLDFKENDNLLHFDQNQIMAEWQFSTIYDDIYNNKVGIKSTPRSSQILFNKVLRQSFNISTTAKTKLQRYKKLIFQQLRLLPYVSPSMRSAQNLYAQLYDFETQRLSHRDLLVRFIPISFNHLDKLDSHSDRIGYAFKSQQVENANLITSVTQFSKLFHFTSRAFHDSFFHATTKDNVVPPDAIAFQDSFDQLPLDYYKSTLQHYSTTGPRTKLLQHYAPHSTHHREISLNEVFEKPPGYNHLASITSIKNIYDFQAKYKTVVIDVPIDSNLNSITTKNDQSTKKKVKLIQDDHLLYIIGNGIKYVRESYEKHNTSTSITISTSIVSNFPVFDRVHIYIEKEAPTTEIDGTTPSTSSSTPSTSTSSSHEYPKIGILYIQETTAQRRKNKNQKGKGKTNINSLEFFTKLYNQLEINRGTMDISSRFFISSPKMVKATPIPNPFDQNNDYVSMCFPFSNPIYNRMKFLFLPTIQDPFSSPSPLM